MILALLQVIVFAAGLITLGVKVRPGAAAGRTGWRWFAAWAIAGFALAFGFAAAFSIVGLLVLPLAVVILIWVARRSPHFSEALGLVGGVGATLLLVAFLNRDSTSCPPGRSAPILPSRNSSGVLLRRSGSQPWLTAGLIGTASR